MSQKQTIRLIHTRLLTEGVRTESLIARCVESHREDPSEGFGTQLLKTGVLSEEQANSVLAAGGAGELVAWIGLPGRTADEILKKVKKEKRVAVLSSLVSRDDLPVSIFETLLKVSKSADLLTDLVRNAAVPAELRLQAARVVVAGILKSKQSASVRSQKAYAILSALSESEIEVIYNEFRSTYFAGMILGKGIQISPQMHSMMLDDLWGAVADVATTLEDAESKIDEAEKQDSHIDFLLQHYVENAIVPVSEFWGNFLSALSNSPLSEENIESLELLLKGLHQHNRSGYSWTEVGRLTQEVTTLISSAAERAKVPVPEISDYNELIQRAQEAVSSYSNANVPFDPNQYLLHPLADYNLALQIINDISCPLMWKRNLVGALVADSRYEYASDLAVKEMFLELDDFLKATPEEDGQDVYELLLKKVEMAEEESGSPAVRHRRDLILSGFAPVDVILELPAEDLLNLGGKMLVSVWSIVEERLGDNPEAWAIFETFVADGGIAIGTAAETASLI